MPKRQEKKRISNATLLRILKYMAKHYHCSKCGVKVSSIQALSRHKRNVHPRFVCGQCKQKYIQPIRFKRHLAENKDCRDFLHNAPAIDLTGPQAVTNQGDAQPGKPSLFSKFHNTSLISFKQIRQCNTVNNFVA